MKHYIFLLFFVALMVLVFFWTTDLCGGIFDTEFEKNIKHLSREDLEQLAIQQHNDFEKLKKDYNKIHIEYTKYFNAYKKETKLPVWFVNKHFSLQAGLSGYLDINNPLRSNIDFIFQGSFYTKWLMFTIGMQPINLNIFVLAGVFFPY